MIQPNEIAMLILGVGVLIFVMINKIDIKRIEDSHYLLYAFYTLLAAWFCTNIETFFLNNVFNFLEHILYTASVILLAIWAFRKFNSN